MPNASAWKPHSTHCSGRRVSSGKSSGAPESRLRPAVVALCALVFLLAYGRIYLGIDLTDEAFAAAMPYSFALGARPFVDEITVHQTAALEILPFVRVYLGLVGSSDGLVLFLRHLYVALVLLACASVYSGLRHIAGPSRSLIVCAALAAIMPCTKPMVSYNTLAVFLFTAAIFSGFAAFQGSPGSNRRFAASGALLVASVFAYPPLSVPALVFGIFLGQMCQGSREVPARKRGLIAFISTVLLGGAIALVVLAAYGLDNVRLAVLLTQDSGIVFGGLAKLSRVLIGAASGVMTAWDNLGRIDSFPLAYYVVSYTALAAPLVLRKRFREAAVRQIVTLVWAPALVAGLVTAYTSSNGFLNATVGLVPAFLVTLALIRHGAIAFGAAVLLLVMQYAFVYRDEPIPGLTCRVSEGPYRGIWTSPARCAFIDQLSADLARFSGAQRTVLFYDGFPAGYLLSNLRASGPTLWMATYEHLPAIDRSTYVRHLGEVRNRPDLVFEIRSLPIRTGVTFAGVTSAEHPVRLLFERLGYGVVADRENYRVLARPRGSPM
jgi:hypothetical protein